MSDEWVLATKAGFESRLHEVYHEITDRKSPHEKLKTYQSAVAKKPKLFDAVESEMGIATEALNTATLHLEQITMKRDSIAHDLTDVKEKLASTERDVGCHQSVFGLSF